MRILVTGVAGFIGSAVAKALLDRGDEVIGVDSVNGYYSPELKEDRLKHFFDSADDFTFYRKDFSDADVMRKIFREHKIDKICHLGAQAGVRYSLENPYAYLKSNIDGTVVLFEMAKEFDIKTVIYASSSSVYGGNEKVPFSEKDDVSGPVSLYAATKRSNELMAYTYHHLYGINMTGLRFFTVYGPWGRPDMALFKFVKNMLEGKEIEVYNYGKMKRDFTYITDIVSGVLASLDKEYAYEIFNLGNNNTIELKYFISVIEDKLGLKAKQKLMEIQPGDVPITYADIEHSKEKLGYDPSVSIEEGVAKFVDWYKEYYGL
ncbi:MAG: NAD-dependent epimerase/dehydratase family protein [Nanobdellota archaeon]